MKSIIDKLIRFYQSNKQGILLIGRYVLIAVVAIVLIRILCNPPIPPPVIDNNIAQVRTLQDRNNNLVAVIQQKDYDLRSNKSLIDSLSHALKVKPKEIKGLDREIVRVDTVWRDSIQYVRALTEKDSTVISRKDRWVDIKAVGKAKGSYINFRLTPDTVNRVTIEKNPLFGRTTRDVYIIHSNPYFQTTNGDSYQEKQRRAVFNLSLSVGYDVINNRVSIGPSLGVPIKTFYSKK